MLLPYLKCPIANDKSNLMYTTVWAYGRHSLPLTTNCFLLVLLAPGDQKGSEMECKPVTASFALTNAINSDTTIGRAAIVSPKDSEGAGTHDTLHSPTTGQLKEVSVRDVCCGVLFAVGACQL